MTIFLRLLETDVADKEEALKNAVRGSGLIFEVEPDIFADMPGSPFAYWARPNVRATFLSFGKFEAEQRIARKGLTTSNDKRYVRVWWEPEDLLRTQKWATYAKGGSSTLFWGSLYTVLRWDWAKRTIPGYCGRAGRETPKVECADLMGNPGLTWPLRAAAFSPSILPEGSVFSARGYTIQAPSNKLLCLLSITSSAAFDALFKLCLGRSGHPEFIVGVLQHLPLPPIGAREEKELSNLARRAWSVKRSLDSVYETSHAFLLPPGLNEKLTGLNVDAAQRELQSIQQRIDELAFALYGISKEDQAAIEASSVHADTTDDEGDDEDRDGDDHDSLINETQEITGLDDAISARVSWLVGVAFGRFDPRLATGHRPFPSEPEPFEPLPILSPGMYPEGDDPADRPDIQVDDEGHAKDVSALVQRWAEHVSVDIPADLRQWLAREFFPLHLKTYSKSARKAPIYWQLATPSASYSVWLYIHALTKDTLFRVQNDYVAGKLAHEERQLETLRAETGPDPVTAQRKAIETQEAFVEELRAFLDDVKRVAPLWNPNLDDGVIINFAPLWRLVPHHKPWQKELKSTWDALCIGKYDWAHLAMHLWPERVVPKCAEDRSLAIAHELEDVFWQQDDDGKWKPREEPTRPIDALVTERTSSAVKAALKSLLEAPEQAGGGRRGRGRR